MSDNENNRRDSDVLIAGAGPVGQVLALLLSQRGLRVSVVERWAQPYPLPRAVAMSHDVLRVLRQLGLGDELAPMLEPWGHDGQRFILQDGAGRTLTETGFTQDSESGFATMSGFSQPDLEELLERRVHADPQIDQRRGFALDALVDDGPGVSATIRPHTGLEPIADGEPQTLRVAYVVGCDGANSTVRSLLGLEMIDLDFNRDWLVVDVVPHTLPTGLPYMCQHLDPARAATLGIHDHALRRSGQGRHTRQRLAAPQTLGDPSRQRRAGPAGPVYVPGPLGHTVSKGPCGPGRRRRARDATIHGPGLQLRHP